MLLLTYKANILPRFLLNSAVRVYSKYIAVYIELPKGQYPQFRTNL